MTLKKAANTVLKQCVDLRKKETLLIITDMQRKKIARAIYEAAFHLCRHVMMVTIPVAEVNGEEPPAIVSEVMKKYNVIIAPTTRSITHTMAVKNARNKGARVATMPGITEAVLKRGMSADYAKVEELSCRIISALRKGTAIRITTKKGTDIRIFRKKASRVIADSGFISKGGLANLPAGEAMLVPDYGRTSGVFVVDASMGGIGKVDRPIRIAVKNGFAVRIGGGRAANSLRNTLKKYGKNAYNIAELGIGTNYKARISGVVLEDEKVFGTAHIALGNSKGLGGPTYAPCHLDGVFRKPTIYVDKKVIMKDGKLLI